MKRTVLKGTMITLLAVSAVMAIVLTVTDDGTLPLNAVEAMMLAVLVLGVFGALAAGGIMLIRDSSRP